MGQIGESLTKARLDKGISLPEAELETKIRVKYLTALEAEDFATIPGRVYVVGFLRTYARYLGLDDQHLVSLLQAETDTGPAIKSAPGEKTPAGGPAALPSPRRSTKRIRAKKGRLAAVILLLLALLAAIYFFINWSQAREGTAVQPPASAAGDNTPPEAEIPVPESEGTETAPPPEPAPAPAAAPETEELAVTVRIKSASCWLAVTIDGKADFSGTLTAGQSMTFRGQDTVSIRFGNAGVAAVTYLGKTLDPVGGQNQVVSRTFSRAE